MAATCITLPKRPALFTCQKKIAWKKGTAEGHRVFRGGTT